MILEKLNNKVNLKKNIYRSSWKLEADKITWQKLGARERGVGESRDGEREGRRGRLQRAWGVEWLRWKKGGYGSREEDILIKGAILELASLDSRGVPRCSKGYPQLGPWAVEERVPKLALSQSHTDEYLEYNHTTSVWRWMEIESETHIGALD